MHQKLPINRNSKQPGWKPIEINGKTPAVLGALWMRPKGCLILAKEGFFCQDYNT